MAYEYGEPVWTTELGDAIATQDLELSFEGDILVASGSQYRPGRIDRLDAGGDVLWTWQGPHTATPPSVSETEDGSVVYTGTPELVVLSAAGQVLDGFAALSHRHFASAPFGDELLIVGNGRGGDPNYVWIEAARWSLLQGQATWIREHRRALSWDGSTTLYSALRVVERHPCGGFVAAGLLPVKNAGCGYQPWIVAFDEAGELLWADRIHRCAGPLVVEIGAGGDIWVLTNVASGTPPLLRRYYIP